MCFPDKYVFKNERHCKIDVSEEIDRTKFQCFDDHNELWFFCKLKYAFCFGTFRQSFLKYDMY